MIEKEYNLDFCHFYDRYGWNYYAEIFGERLLAWMKREKINVRTMLDLGCGTGILCGVLAGQGIATEGMDLSEGMLELAREKFPDLIFTHGNMVTFRAGRKVDLVTCTYDAINHIFEPGDVLRVFCGAYEELEDNGWFVFDFLDGEKIETCEPQEIDRDEETGCAMEFCVRRSPDDFIILETRKRQGDSVSVIEQVREKIHDPGMMYRLLQRAGFSEIVIADRLPGEEKSSSVWYAAAHKK